MTAMGSTLNGAGAQSGSISCGIEEPRGQGERRVSVARDSPSCSPCSRDVGVKAAWWGVSGKVSSVQILLSCNRQAHDFFDFSEQSLELVTFFLSPTSLS